MTADVDVEAELRRMQQRLWRYLLILGRAVTARRGNGWSTWVVDP